MTKKQTIVVAAIGLGLTAAIGFGSGTPESLPLETSSIDRSDEIRWEQTIDAYERHHESERQAAEAIRWEQTIDAYRRHHESERQAAEALRWEQTVDAFERLYRQGRLSG